MTTVKRRITSFLMAAAMLIGSTAASFYAFADETEMDPIGEVKADGDGSISNPESEMPEYFISIPYIKEASIGVDEFHVRDRAFEGDTILAYKAGEEVKVSIQKADGFEIERLFLKDAWEAEYPYSYEREDTIVFQMPETDLRVELIMRELPKETEKAAALEAVVGGIDGKALEAGTYPEDVPEILKTETTGEDGVPGSIEDLPSDIPSEAMTEADGFPVEGSMVGLSEIAIGIDAKDIEIETNFPEVKYPEDTCVNTYISNNIVFGKIGVYEVIYRVSENNIGRFWYLVRPVRVEELTETETEKGSENSDPDNTALESETADETVSDVSDVKETESAEEMDPTLNETERDQTVSEAVSGDGDTHNIFFEVKDGYSISMANDQVTFHEGDEVSFTVKTDEDHVICTAAAYIAYSTDERTSESTPADNKAPEDSTAAPDTDTTENALESALLAEERNAADGTPDEISAASPVLITEETVPLLKMDSIEKDNETVEATYSFEMPPMDVAIMATAMLAASASTDIEVDLDNGAIKNIPKVWTPDGKTWSQGSTSIGYTKYRTVTLPDGEKRRAYCLQPTLRYAENGTYTATEVRKKGKLSEEEAILLRKALFYSYGGPGWATGDIKAILSDCDTSDEYYVATHYILAKIYCNATGGSWNTAGGSEAVNARGKAAIEAAVNRCKELPDPTASLSTNQASAACNGASGFAESQPITFSSSVPANHLHITLPANVYLTVVGGATFSPGQKADIPANATFILKKNGYERAHQEAFIPTADIFTDFDAYMINVPGESQNMGFSTAASKEFALLVNWPDFVTHLNIVKVDSHTGSTTATQYYNIDGAVYGIYADAGRSQLLEQLTIQGGRAVSSDSYLIGQTYYVAEIYSPVEYHIDGNVYPVTATAGGTATVTSKDVPKTIRISVQKTDKETGLTKPFTKALTFEGAVFGIYSDAACTVKAVDINGREVPDIRTNADGLAQTDETLLINNYYIKELSPPVGYLINEEIFSIDVEGVRSEIVNQDSNAEFTCPEYIIRANVDLMKVKTIKGLYDESAEGVEFYFSYVNDPDIHFTVIAGREDTIITDAEGYATTKHDDYPRGTLIYGEWRITEGNTPEGFEAIDPMDIMVTGNDRTYRFVANNRQIHAAVLIEKHDKNTGSLIPAEGVKFSLYKDGEKVSLFNPTSRQMEDSWITDKDGMVQLPEMLDYGIYKVKEDPESLPDGYFVMEEGSFLIEEMADEYLHPLTFYAMEPPQMGNIMVEKKDIETGEKLQGFTFEIVAAEDITDPVGVIRKGEDADGNEVEYTAGCVVDRIVTGKNGNAVSKDLFLGKYTVREVETANGYAITDETKDVLIKGDNGKAKKGENVSEYVLFENHPTTLKILKKNKRSDDPIAGITFLVHELKDGQSISDYEYKGEEEPSGGTIPMPIKGETDKETEAEVIDNTGNTKESDPSDNAAENTEEKQESAPSEESIASDPWDETTPEETSGLDEDSLDPKELFVTDENGEIKVEYLNKESTYVIREIKTIPGYNLSHEMVSFAVDENGLIDGSFIKEVTMMNEPNTVRISKVDITNSKEIPGAKLTITDSSGKVYDEWTSTYEVHEINALPAGIYTLTETTAPEGYEVSESITFKVINSRKIQTGVMKDSSYREVEISKTDITGDKEIPGAHLTITDKNGVEIESWESTETAHTTKIPSGDYILTETKPADGYVTAESIPFTVKRTSAEDFEVLGLSMKDDITKVEISKVDITNSKPVIGAELIIKDAEGNEIEKWTTEEKPHYIEMLPIGTYTLTEITAPSGYATAETVEFSVLDTGEIQKVEMKDAPITVEISKKDIVDGPGGKELPGAHLTVKNEKGEVIDEWTSTSEPHKIEKLPAGKYTLTEVTAPKGYDVAESVSFDVADSGEIHKVVMYDKPKEETVDLTGKKTTTTSGREYSPGSPGTSVITPPVRTGDDTPIALWILIAVFSLGAGITVLHFRKKRKAA